MEESYGLIGDMPIGHVHESDKVACLANFFKEQDLCTGKEDDKFQHVSVTADCPISSAWQDWSLF